MTIIVTPILADAIVVLVTWYSTFRQVKNATSLGLHTGFSGVLLQDGAIPSDSPALGTASTFAFFLRPVLIVRFLINLRYVDAESSTTGFGVGPKGQTETETNCSSPRFRTAAQGDSVLGNMGASMDYSVADGGEGYIEADEEEEGQGGRERGVFRDDEWQ
ncbi:hypothetical protein EIP86_000048 [Pleurotus ostreatoroseus]|nr:hypothetical protein EIP86_000048 [Pleurotus ostreatoroseus]